MSKKGVVLHLENEKKLLDDYQKLFNDSEIDLDFVPCSSIDEFNQAIKTHEGKVKSVIFDLVGDKATDAELKGNPEFLATIKTNFANYNLPIFIYSARLDLIEKEFNSGTVMKLPKDDSISKIFSKIKLYLDSGFIDVFCPDGILEKEIRDELHGAFTKQFSQPSQIDEVISSIIKSEADPKQQNERVKKIFKRITIRTLASDLLAPIADSEDKVHPIEHFYKRQSKLKIWTGDIWKDKNKGNHVVVLTPRCDFAIGKAKQLIFCVIEPLPKPIDTKGKPEQVIKNLRDYLTDNRPGKSQRYIPTNTFFPDGGMANLAEHFTMEIEEFQQNFQYVVTLSDDLTNELIGKFAYYFLRTGITNISEQEFEAIIKAIQSEDGKK